MGNNCKAFEKLSNRSECYPKRIQFQTGDHFKHKINELRIELPHDMAWTKASCLSTSELGSKGIRYPPLDVRTEELVRICLKNRPAGVSDDNWERFLSSVCFEYSKNDVKGSLDTSAGMKAAIWETPSPLSLYVQNDVKGDMDTSAGLKTAIWATPSPRSQTRSIANTIMDKASQRSSSVTNYSSVELAGRFVFPDKESDDSTDSSSLSSLSAWTLSRCGSERSYAKFISEDYSDSDLGTICNEKLKSRYRYRLGDLAWKSCEDSSSCNENKISSKANSQNMISFNANSTSQTLA